VDRFGKFVTLDDEFRQDTLPECLQAARVAAIRKVLKNDALADAPVTTGMARFPRYVVR
jgi:hypothetical protein